MTRDVALDVEKIKALCDQLGVFAKSVRSMSTTVNILKKKKRMCIK
jgi:hypothetical protein